MRTRGNVSVRSRSNWNLEVLVFKERGKPEYPEKKLSEQRNTQWEPLRRRGLPTPHPLNWRGLEGVEWRVNC